MGFKQAVRGQRKIHIGITGLSGSGKTEAALRLATMIAANEARKRADGSKAKIAGVCSEGGSMSIYADRFHFDLQVLDRQNQDPRRYMDAVREAIEAGYDVVILDSISHEWRATSKLGADQGWHVARPLHEAFMDAITKGQAIHTIATMREGEAHDFAKKKTERGGEKLSVTKLGLAPIQDGEAAYEFDSVLKLGRVHNVTVDKTRCQALNLGRIFPQVNDEIGGILIRWADYGDIGAGDKNAKPLPPSPKEEPPKEAPKPASDAAATIASLYREIGARAKEAMELDAGCAEAWTSTVGDRKATYAQVQQSQFPDPLAAMLSKANAFVEGLRAKKAAPVDAAPAGFVPPGPPTGAPAGIATTIAGAAPQPTEMERLEAEDDDAPPPRAKTEPAPEAPNVEPIADAAPKKPTARDFWKACKEAGWPKDDQRDLYEYVTGEPADGPLKLEPAKIPAWIERVKSIPYDAAAVALVRAGKASAKAAEAGQ